MSYLSIEETKILLSIPNADSKKGLRDLAIIAVLYECAARVQELIDLTASNLHVLNSSSYMELRGKGNKLRKIPIADAVSEIIKAYINSCHIRQPDDPLFVNSQKKKLTRAGVQHIINKYIDLARERNSGLFRQKITNHSFRHSKAMHLLEAGVNLVYIRDFLGHSSVTTTEIYAKTNPEVKRRILTENNILSASGVRYDSNEKNDLLEWLKHSL
jgi:site-specific recombinase XerD